MPEGTRKVVINACYGGFGLSKKAIDWLKEKGQEGAIKPALYDWTVARDDPLLIEAVETLGEDVNDDCAELKIVEIPADVEWEIEEAEDGHEWVAEKHRTWGLDDG